jgi:hypothetical protein
MPRDRREAASKLPKDSARPLVLTRYPASPSDSPVIAYRNRLSHG